MVSRWPFPLLVWFDACFLSEPDVLVVLAGARLIHARMVVLLATVKQE
jgi:hypothetical protein